MLLRIAPSLIALLSITSVLLAKDRRRDYDDFFPPTPQVNPAANQARSEADQAYQRGDYPRVIELADQLLTYYPTDNPHVAYHLRASARIELGKAANSAKQIREGIADARTAVTQSGTQFRWLYVPYLYGMSTLAEIENRPEHADTALQVVTPILRLPTGEGYSVEDKAALYYQRALAHAARRDLKSAVADWSEALQLSPQHLGSHLKRAEAYVQLNQTKNARSAYDELVRLFPTTLVVFNGRGTFRRNTGDLDGAATDFTRAVQIDPKFAVGYLNRGMCLADQNNASAAEADFTAALKLRLDPAYQALAHHLRAQARLSQGNVAGSLADYSDAIKRTPQNAVLYQERGFADFFKKDHAAAQADFSKVLQLDPHMVRVIPWQALNLARLGHTAEARASLERIAELKTTPDAWVSKLCAYLNDQVSEQDLLAAANELGEAGRAARLCEARYFIGQKQLLATDADAATRQFREAVATRSFTLAAYRGARYELGDFSQN